MNILTYLDFWSCIYFLLRELVEHLILSFDSFIFYHVLSAVSLKVLVFQFLGFMIGIFINYSYYILSAEFQAGRVRWVYAENRSWAYNNGVLGCTLWDEESLKTNIRVYFNIWDCLCFGSLIRACWTFNHYSCLVLIHLSGFNVMGSSWLILGAWTFVFDFVV